MLLTWSLVTADSAVLPLSVTCVPPLHRLEGICLERWGRMEGQLAACYQGMQLRPPPAELRRWFRAARQAG